MKKIINPFLNILLYCLLIGLIIFIVSFSDSDYKGIKKIGDFAICNVLTGSMSPSIEAGSLIVIKEVNVDDIKVDDVLTFIGESSEAAVTHRVKEKNNSENGVYFTTKGDANDVVDSFPIKPEMIVGKVIFHIPFAGSVILFIQNNLLILIVIAGSIFVLDNIVKRYMSKKI